MHSQDVRDIEDPAKDSKYCSCRIHRGLTRRVWMKLPKHPLPTKAEAHLHNMSQKQQICRQQLTKPGRRYIAQSNTLESFSLRVCDNRSFAVGSSCLPVQADLSIFPPRFVLTTTVTPSSVIVQASLSKCTGRSHIQENTMVDSSARLTRSRES